ncbi:MAG: DUF1049 domain-containing protein, partial [Rhodobacteraceae bacterium]|nr:DUF1049 domain-containing protein [Paracoccaceae bacterium]
RLDLPLFLVIFVAFAIGVATGFVWEWLREHGHRRRARQGAGRVARLERELAVMATSNNLPPKDEVLALIDAAPKADAKAR